MIHVGLEQMGRVGYQARGVAMIQQNLGNRGVLVRNLVPTVVAVDVRESAHAGETTVSYLDGLAGFGKTAIESRRFSGERVKRRVTMSLNRLFCPTMSARNVSRQMTTMFRCSIVARFLSGRLTHPT